MAKVELMAEATASAVATDKNTTPSDASPSILDTSGPVEDADPGPESANYPQPSLPAGPKSSPKTSGPVMDANPGQSTSPEDDPAVDSASSNAAASRQPSISHSRGTSRRSSRSNSPQKRKVGMEGLLAFLDEGYELFEVGNGGGVRKLDTVPDSKTLRRHKQNFILRRKTTHQKADEATRLFNGGQGIDSNVDRFDYEKRYPPDEPGQEKAPGARIWRVYMDEAGQFDLDMVENMRDTVDVILVFAGLFSAIVTTLVALTATALQLDHPKVTNLLLMELIALQRAAITGDSIDQIIPSPLNAESASNSTADPTDYWINGLWFTSLAFSLSTALIAVLVKQWIQAYVAPSFQGTPKAQAEVRHFRYRGIETWHVPLIIGLLPTLLHLSLFLFFADLVVFLFTLDVTIASVVTAITSTACVAYLVTNLLPVSYPGCPYRTPLSHYAFFILHTCRTWFISLWRYTPVWWDAKRRYSMAWEVLVTALYLPCGVLIRAPWYTVTRPSDTLWEFIIRPIQSVRYFRHYPYTSDRNTLSLKETETQAIETAEDELHSHMFGWLFQTSAANPSAKSAIVSCLSNDPINFTHLQPPLIPRADWNRLLQRMISFHVMSSETTLNRARLVVVFGRIRGGGARLHSHKSIANGLISAHKYSKACGFSSIDEDTYNLSSRVDWEDFSSYSAGLVFLSRFCTHVLYTSPLTLLDHGPSSNSNLPLLYPALRSWLWTGSVRPTPEALHKFNQLVPTPTLADSLPVNAGRVAQLQLLLEVGTSLLGLAGLDISDSFKEAEYLVFWRIVYDRHNNDISQDLAEAFLRMIDRYVYRAIIHEESPDHIHHVMEHLQTICLWHTACPAYEGMSWSMTWLAERDPWNTAWQEVQDTLPGLLLTDEAKQSGGALLRRLTTFLQNVQPRPSPRAAIPSLSIADSPVTPDHQAAEQSHDNAAASAITPVPAIPVLDHTDLGSSRDSQDTVDVDTDTTPRAASGSPSTTNNSTLWARARRRLNLTRFMRTSAGSGHIV